MTQFTTRETLSVRRPYRLDFTVDALRRLASNAVDVIGEDGAYYRALSIDGEPEIIRVTQIDEETMLVEASGSRARLAAAVVRRMLGVDVDLREWRRRSGKIPWLRRIAHDVDGVHPPRYPTMWEAAAHAIVFQQISIHAASAIMRRMVESLGERLQAGATAIHLFPSPHALLAADETVLIGAGLSTNKRLHLRSVAEAILSGQLDEAEIEAMPTPQAAAVLSGVRGIGPWSASVVLLRGFGRLDAFPLRDSGVARAIKQLSGDPEISVDEVLEILGSTRGMLYFHLLLGKLRLAAQLASS